MTSPGQTRARRWPTWLLPGTLGLMGAGMASRLVSGPHLFDSGELVAAAWELGASHPPGQPLHALLAHAFMRLPLGPMPARVALFSAACVLAAAAVVAQMVGELSSEPSALRVQLAKVAAAVGVVHATPVLRQALRPEVYGLALFLTMLAILQVLRWHRSSRRGHLYAAALWAGLAAAVHLPHAAAASLVGLGVLLMSRAHGRLLLPALPGCIGLGALGLGIYAMLPVRGLVGVAQWGDPTTGLGFWRYISGYAYSHHAFTSTGSRPLSQTAIEYGVHAAQTAGIAAAAGAIVLILLNRGQKSTAKVALLGALLSILACFAQPLQILNPDNVAYLGPAVALLIVAGAAGWTTLSGRGLTGRIAGGIGLAAVAFHPGTGEAVMAATLTETPALETLGGALVETPPPRSLVVATTDFAAATWMQARQIDRARPDVALFVAGLAASSWHWRTLSSHPALDATPRRGAGRDAHAGYLQGAIDMAVKQVPVAFERDHPSAIRSRLTGPYAVLTKTIAVHRSIGERLASTIARAAPIASRGEPQLAAAILCDHHIVRSRRLLARDRSPEALSALIACLPQQWKRTRATLSAAEGSVSRRLPPVVIDPGAFLASPEGAVRNGVVSLWAMNAPLPARDLLQWQAQRGDARALLQLGWLQVFEGDHAGARQSHAAFVEQAPALAAEADNLGAQLE